MLLIHRDTEFIPLPEEIYERKANWRQVKQKWHITQSHSAIFNRTVNIPRFVREGAHPLPLAVAYGHTVRNRPPVNFS